MKASDSPKISVIIVTPDGYQTIGKTIEHLRRQTIRDKIEVVIVAPSASSLTVDDGMLKDFFGTELVEVGEMKTTGAAIAAGVRAASAPVVAYAEEHSYPAPRWAEALVRRHGEGWAAVGAAVANANPASMISWAHLYAAFGQWVEPVEGGTTNNLAWHHTSYKRALLMEYDPALEAMLETEGILHRDLRRKGHRLYVEPHALSQHVNVSLLSSYLGAEFHSGRLFGAARARHSRWPVWRRLLYVGGSPLIPLVRLRRILREIKRSGRQRELLPKILPALAVGLACHAVGEAAGYALGPGGAHQRRLTYELNRQRHVTTLDRQAQASAAND